MIHAESSKLSNEIGIVREKRGLFHWNPKKVVSVAARMRNFFHCRIFMNTCVGNSKENIISLEKLPLPNAKRIIGAARFAGRD